MCILQGARGIEYDISRIAPEQAHGECPAERRGKSDRGCRKRRRKPEPQEDRSYLDSLADIKKETVADRKLFYSRVYRLLLSYLEKERGLDVSGKTGEEVIEIVGGLEDDSEKAGMVRWLNEARKVKYQPNTPSPGDVENSYNALCVFFENKAKKK